MPLSLYEYTYIIYECVRLSRFWYIKVGKFSRVMLSATHPRILEIHHVFLSFQVRSRSQRLPSLSKFVQNHIFCQNDQTWPKWAIYIGKVNLKWGLSKTRISRMTIRSAQTHSCPYNENGSYIVYCMANWICINLPGRPTKLSYPSSDYTSAT